MSVIVVGGGPAGSVVALLLARAGIDVTLLERAASPRPKPCGDCLSAGATRLLDDVGLLAAVERARPAHLDGWRIVSPGGCTFAARFDDLDTGDPRLGTALAISRDRLDAVLLDAARHAGADVRTRTAVTDVSLGAKPSVTFRADGLLRTEHADLVVGADGLRSTVVRRLGSVRRRARVRKVSLTAHVEGVALADAHGEMHVIEDLCAGLAPVGDGRCNLTLVADADRYGRSIAHDALAFFTSALRRFPALAGRLTEATLHGVPLLGPTRAGSARASGLLASGPFDVPVRRIVGPGWALVGDAAGYFDPFTGQGICQAMLGAEMLAAAIVETTRSPERRRRALADYAARHRRLTRPTRAVQRIVDAVLRRPALADLAIARLGRAPLAARALLATTGDVEPPSSLLSPHVLLSFAFPQPRSAG